MSILQQPNVELSYDMSDISASQYEASCEAAIPTFLVFLPRLLKPLELAKTNSGILSYGRFVVVVGRGIDHDE